MYIFAGFNHFLPLILQKFDIVSEIHENLIWAKSWRFLVIFAKFLKIISGKVCYSHLYIHSVWFSYKETVFGKIDLGEMSACEATVVSGSKNDRQAIKSCMVSMVCPVNYFLIT